jgi:hypothetical protein
MRGRTRMTTKRMEGLMESWNEYLEVKVRMVR